VVKIKKISLILIILGILFFSPLTYSQEEGDSFPATYLGELDWTRNFVELEGEWEFYWEKLLTPEDFQQDYISTPVFIEVPGAWNRFELDGQTLSRSGFATYRTSFSVGENMEFLGIKIPPIPSSFRLWVNGNEIASAGEVGTSKEEANLQFFPQTVFFPTDEDYIELIIQVANYYYPRGGLVENIILGPADNINLLQEKSLSWNYFLLGSLFALGLLHIVLFFFRNRWFFLLFFGSFCLFFGFMIFLEGGGDFPGLIGSLSWDWAQKIKNLCFFLGLGALSLFYKHLYSVYIPRAWVIVSLIIVGGFSLSSILFSPGVFSGIKLFSLVIFLALSIFVFKALFMAAWKKEPGALLMLAGLFILILVGVYDFLYLRVLGNFPGFFPGGNLFQLGLLIFILFNSFALGVICIKKIGEKENQLEEITEANEDLEARIIEGLKEIEQSNDKIEQQEREIQRCHKALEKVSLRDPLTEVWNRQYFKEMFSQEWERGQQENSHLSLIFLDIDDFQHFNQKYGHRIGDQLLIKIAQVLKSFSRRPGEIVARYGGEEFLFLLPGTTMERALEMGENIRRKIEGLYLFHDSGRGYKPVTVSIGIATTVPDEASIPESLIAQAENAMYRAKDEGKNRVETDFLF